jgi:hypothetical protein
MPWSSSSLFAQREQFVRLARQHAVPFCELCRQFNISRKTGYKWLQRREQEGVSGLRNRSRGAVRRHPRCLRCRRLYQQRQVPKTVLNQISREASHEKRAREARHPLARRLNRAPQSLIARVESLRSAVIPQVLRCKKAAGFFRQEAIDLLASSARRAWRRLAPGNTRGFLAISVTTPEGVGGIAMLTCGTDTRHPKPHRNAQEMPL